jgi:hypothetical protein
MCFLWRFSNTLACWDPRSATEHQGGSGSGSGCSVDGAGSGRASRSNQGERNAGRGNRAWATKLTDIPSVSSKNTVIQQLKQEAQPWELHQAAAAAQEKEEVQVPSMTLGGSSLALQLM